MEKTDKEIISARRLRFSTSTVSACATDTPHPRCRSVNRWNTMRYTQLPTPSPKIGWELIIHWRPGDQQEHSSLQSSVFSVLSVWDPKIRVWEKSVSSVPSVDKKHSWKFTGHLWSFVFNKALFRRFNEVNLWFKIRVRKIIRVPRRHNATSLMQ